LMDVRELWVMRCGALGLGAAVANEKRFIHDNTSFKGHCHYCTITTNLPLYD
jgi:hypothetical protein